MQLTIPHVELKQALAGLTRVVPKRATLPVLQMVRFAHEGGRITVAGTDLDQNLAYRFAHATAQGEGAFLIGLADLQLLAKGAEGDVGLKAVSATDIEISHTLGGQPVTPGIIGGRATVEHVALVARHPGDQRPGGVVVRLLKLARQRGRGVERKTAFQVFEQPVDLCRALGRHRKVIRRKQSLLQAQLLQGDGHGP